MTAPGPPRVEFYGKLGGVELSQVPRLEDCHPGLSPLEFNVIVAPAEMPERIGSILLSDESREQLGASMQLGRLVAASPLAFTYERWPAGVSPPKAGAVVWFARFGGGEFEGLDGRTYRTLKDKDLIGTVDAPASSPVTLATTPMRATGEVIPAPETKRVEVTWVAGGPGGEVAA